MKVIGITGNYGTEDGMSPRCYLMADSSILYSGRPFFVPDFAQRFVACPSIVVRTSRLGKGIAPKFASRYWDALTAGMAVQAINDCDASAGALDRAFDGAAIVGEWVPVSSLDDPTHAVVTTMINGEVQSQQCLAHMTLSLDHLLAGISQRCSIKMGDMIFTGDAGSGHNLAPGDRITATIGGRQVLDVKVKL